MTFRGLPPAPYKYCDIKILKISLALTTLIFLLEQLKSIVKPNENIMTMASLAPRSKGGVLALATLSASLAKTCAFNNHHLRYTSTLSSIISPTTSSSHIIRRAATSSSADTKSGADDPLFSSDIDYEWLKSSRPMRIHATPLPPIQTLNNGDTSTQPSTPKNIIGSSSITKIVHFQRHGQGTHNQLYKDWTERTGSPPDLNERDPTKNPLLLEDIIDAPLTTKGKNQCLEQSSFAYNELYNIELIICSPLVRALQTAHLTFSDYVPPNRTNSGKMVKWIVHEGIREEFGTLLCNKRQPLSRTMSQFVEVDYMYMGSTAPSYTDEDTMWNEYTTKNKCPDTGLVQRESMIELSDRAYQFLVNFLLQRPEKEIVVVGHSAWFHAMTNSVLYMSDSCSENGEVLDYTTMFGQAEIRSFELVFLNQ